MCTEVYWLAVVRVEGVAVTEELLHVTALEQVDSPPWAVLVTKPTPTTAGANSHLVTVTLQLCVPV